MPDVWAFPHRPEDAEASLTPDGWRRIGWLVDDWRDQTSDVWWHAGRGEGRLRPWVKGPSGLRPPGS